MSVDTEFVQAIRECTESLRKITDVMGAILRELDEATRRMASLPWKVEPVQVTLADAASMLSLRPSSVRGLVAKGELEVTGKARGLRVTVESIHAYTTREARSGKSGTSSTLKNPFSVPTLKRGTRARSNLPKPPETNSAASIFRTWDGPFKCEGCGLGFDSERGLKSHKHQCRGKHELRKPRPQS